MIKSMEELVKNLSQLFKTKIFHRIQTQKFLLKQQNNFALKQIIIHTKSN